jgi:hypothetical protein
MKHPVLLLVLASISVAACGGSSQQSSTGVVSAGAGGALGASSGAGGSVGGAALGGSSGASTSVGGATLGGTSGASSGGLSNASGGSAGGVTASSGSGGAPITLGCAGWQVQTASGDQTTAKIAGGALVLTRPAGTMAFSGPYNGDIALTQAGLSGDFDVTVSWQAFAPGDAKPFVGPRFSAGAWWQDPSGLIYQATGSVGAATGEAAIIHGQQFTINSLDPSPTPASFAGATGSFQIQRTGTSMTVTTTMNAETVSAQSTVPFSEQPLTLVMWMDDTSESGTPSMSAAGVTITRVQVSGGGGTVKSDDFSCP